MNCLKCGIETKNEQTFCARCLEDMARYPVKPGTPVQIPDRNASTVKKASGRKNGPSPEEQVVQLRRTVKWLSVGLGCLLLMLSLTVGLLFHMTELSDYTTAIGQNFSTRSASGS